MLRTLTIGLVLLCSGCTTRGSVDAATVEDLVAPIVARHDAYVQADATLSEDERRIYLRSSEILRGLLRTAKEQAGK